MPLRSRRSPLSRQGGRALVMLLAASLALAGPAGATPHGNGDEALRNRLRELVDRPDGPPGAIAVLRDGGRVRVIQAGVAEVGTRREPRATDHMRLASASKAYRVPSHSVSSTAGCSALTTPSPAGCPRCRLPGAM